MPSFERLRRNLRRHSLFVVILILAALGRIFLLFYSQTHVNSDEAVIGLMGKHVLEGRYLSFYMYGQTYNAGAAWEAYGAALIFAVFGIGVIQLKAVVLVLSLACLILFYRLGCQFYARRTALLAVFVFVLFPSLLKWHFQVRGYSWYFLSIPILTSLFLSIEADPHSKAINVFFLGLASGLSVWCLELILSLVAAFWCLLAVRRKLSRAGVIAGLLGFLLGYAPAIVFNFTHEFSNWRSVFLNRPHADAESLFQIKTFINIFFGELPRFFGSDTVYWYYSWVPVGGVVLYGIAVAGIVVVTWPLLRAPARILQGLRTGLTETDEAKDLLMLLLAAACFIPYVAAGFRVPGYFLGGSFFLSFLIGRLIERCGVAVAMSFRLLGYSILLAIFLIGTGAMVEMGRHNEIETLVVKTREDAVFRTNLPQGPARFAGADIDGVQRHLREKHVSSVLVTMPFLYPLLFESGETLAVSDPILHSESWCYPAALTMPAPPVVDSPQPPIFVIETASPFLKAIQTGFARLTGVEPVVVEYGALSVIEARD